MAELVSRKRYFDYVTDILQKESFSNMMLPASIGISDPLLNNLMNEFIIAQTQRSNLVANKQERNPMVQSLGIKVENLKKTISENISALSNSTSISIDELNKRIRKIEAEINRLPATQRQLGTIERKYRLSDAIYNYLMEKHAEAKITKASNLPDDIIIEPAKVKGMISPNKKMNFLIALFLGLGFPFGLVWIKSALNNKIETQDDVEHLTDSPVLGKILHNSYKTNHVMLEFPQSNISESVRALRTNLDFYVRGGQKKVILITSCFENEGKSFIAQNLALSYAQLGRRTILLDFDLRKPKTYFNENDRHREGLSSYMIDKADLDDIIIKSPHEKLDYITSGILPPNPIELIALERNEMLMSELKKKYDIIIIDSTPLAQVADAYLLIEHAEVKVIVTRYGQTIKNVLALVMKDLNQKNVSNICIVLNDNKEYRDQYGYGYGYYNRKGFFQRNFKKKSHSVKKV
jgi:capsular exopolysaccharide synthesis family protein